MSYYNFNDHFWSPKTVCPQKSLVKPKETTNQIKKIKILSYMVCIAICTPLLFGIYSRLTSKNPKNTLVNFDNSNCLILTRNQGMQLYCSNTQP
ncbi:hypothetical protein NIES2111_22550 [Nostoc sp. NIES-2111]|nr:hypothetical protein NIES2111_22550 [Nostoc sp. NIES-2111]